MSLPYGQDLNNEINIDKSATRVMVITQENDSKEVNRIKIACETWLAENAPAYMASKATGNGVMFASIAERTIRGIVITTPIALIVVSLLLIGLFKSVRFGLISLIPNLVPIVAAFGVWGFLFGRINFGVACVAGLSIGIVVDDTVHFMSKYLRARRQENMTPEDAVRYTFSTVDPARFEAFAQYVRVSAAQGRDGFAYMLHSFVVGDFYAAALEHRDVGVVGVELFEL